MFATAGSATQATTISKALVQDKLAACVNIVPQIVSVYEWQGQLEEGAESLLIIKVRYSRYGHIYVSNWVEKGNEWMKLFLHL